MDDPVNGPILSGTTYVFVLRFPVIVGEEVLVGDGIHVNVVFVIGGERKE